VENVLTVWETIILYRRSKELATVAVKMTDDKLKELTDNFVWREWSNYVARDMPLKAEKLQTTYLTFQTKFFSVKFIALMMEAISTPETSVNF
jgi:hypothetical protein